MHIHGVPNDSAAKTAPGEDALTLRRDFLFTMRLTPEERDQLTALAERAGCSGAEYLRRFIKREHGALAPERAKPLVKPARARRKT